MPNSGCIHAFILFMPNSDPHLNVAEEQATIPVLYSPILVSPCELACFLLFSSDRSDTGVCSAAVVHQGSTCCVFRDALFCLFL